MTPEQIALLKQWEEAKLALLQVKPVVAKELELRKRVFALFFPKPKEGVNKFELAGDYLLKGTHKIDRKVDEAVLEDIQNQMREEFQINPDLLIEMKPSLKMATYRELTAEQRKMFDQALTIKPSTPTIELVAPKEKKK